jgi:hypothetical protein
MKVHNMVVATVYHMVQEAFINNSNLQAVITDMAINIKVMYMIKANLVVLPKFLE